MARGRIVYGKPIRYLVDDVEVTKEDFDAAFPAKDFSKGPAFTQATGWPKESSAAGVHPDQVQEAMVESAKRGVPTEYNKKGRPIMRDRAHRRAYNKAHGFRDNDGGYGD